MSETKLDVSILVMEYCKKHFIDPLEKELSVLRTILGAARTNLKADGYKDDNNTMLLLNSPTVGASSLTSENDRLRKGIDWMAQTVHRAHHRENEFKKCPMNTCDYARQLLTPKP